MVMHMIGSTPRTFDWESFFSGSSPGTDEHQEVKERKADLGELRWFLQEVNEELNAYREQFPDRRFEKELSGAFRHRADQLLAELAHYDLHPMGCGFDRYITLKYEIRTLLKQLGPMLSGSDWQTPCKLLSDQEPEASAEVGYMQEEQGTYMRSYGSEFVKSYERRFAEQFFPMSYDCRQRSVGFLTTSGMKALEVALIAYKTHTGEAYPLYYQSGFYCEGADLARALMKEPKELTADEIYRKLDSQEPVGCLLVDPAVCWPVRPAVDLEILFVKLQRHRQKEPLYVIVDRTLTSLANPLFERYGDKLPAHVVLVAVESGIKYYQYGLDLANIGFVAAAGRQLQQDGEAVKRWVDLMGMLSASPDPTLVRMIPAPHEGRVKARLRRLNRNAHWFYAFLNYMKERGHIRRYYLSVEPSPRYVIDDRPWIGSVFYIRKDDGYSEADYQQWIDRLAASAPPELHFVSGGSFGFDTFRLNAVSASGGSDNALRCSVGRDTIGQLLVRLRFLHDYLVGH